MMDPTPELENVSLAIKDINRSTHTKFKTGFNISPEILLSMFLRAIPPYALLDTTLVPGENSAWCRTLELMQSVVLVCRSWHNAGVVFLYENVCIRRCHQLESLRRTLTTSKTNLRLLVKSLTIQCYIPEDRNVDFCTDLEAVVGCCTSLAAFAYNARFDLPAQLMIRFPAYITHFQLEGGSDYDGLFEILTQLKETLLSFRLIWDDQSANSEKLWPQLYLPSLQSLSITFLDSLKIGVLNTLGHHLTMPSLQRLTLAFYTFNKRANHVNDRNLQNGIPYVFTFLELHGGQLRQLNISDIPLVPEKFKQALNFCPRLERVILHPSTLLRRKWTKSDLDDFFHPNLRWIDFTHYLDDIEDYRSSKLCLWKVNLPSLENVRRFCDFPFVLLKWLDEYPPSTGTEKFVIDVYQHKLDCRERLFVWTVDLDPILEDQNGGKYEPTSSESETSSDSETSSNSETSSDSDSDDTSSSQDLEFEWTSEDGDYDL